MSIERTITCYVEGTTVVRMISSDNRLTAGFVGDDSKTRLTFVLPDELWSGLAIKCIVWSPSELVKLSTVLDENQSVVLTKEILDVQGPVKFTLTGYYEAAKKDIR